MTEARIFGEHDERTKEQMARCMQYGSVRGGVLCADGHLGYAQPVGGVIAYDEHISVSGVGFDIACGNMAVKLDVPKKAIEDRIEPILQDIVANVSFGLGRANKEKVEHEVFDSPLWQKSDVVGRLKSMAREQLGTVGSGNHYVDVFSDELGRIWVGVHFGSRGFGHTIASGFLALSQNARWGTRVPEREALLDLSMPIGDAYWSLMELGGKYAYTGREWVARKVVKILGGKELDLVHNHHNFAWKEKQGGEDLIVVRKGATPAFPGQRGFVGGSMGDDAVILEGSSAAPEQSEAALWSTVHGAGRVMSRTEARGKKKGWGPKARIVSPGKVSWEMVNEWLGPRGVILRGGGLDEAPQAYRRLPEVLAAQGDTVKVLHTLKPLIVVMAGENEYDPYKD
jgi:tRNA-splicing ligase RtcB (3'-phosphate/5'-hydroxy nucleic acid ligase)